MPTTTQPITSYNPSGWQLEDPAGAGNWCYAATTRAVRGALLNEQLAQVEIAHNFYSRINEWGGPAVAGIGGTRGTAITNYMAAIRQPAGAAPIPFAHVQAWVATNQLGGVNPIPWLSQAWGDVHLDGLTQQSINSATADNATEERICQTLHANGLVVVGTALHFKVIYGYEMDVDDDDTVLARRFYVWDPAAGVVAAPVDLADFTGDKLTFVTR